MTRKRRLQKLKQWQDIVGFLEAETERVEEKLDEARNMVWKYSTKGPRRKASAYDRWFAKTAFEQLKKGNILFGDMFAGEIPKKGAGLPLVKLYRNHTQATQ